MLPISPQSKVAVTVFYSFLLCVFSSNTCVINPLIRFYFKNEKKNPRAFEAPYQRAGMHSLLHIN
jgi:hypothetical protein